MMALGVASKSWFSVALLALISLCLIAWIHDAPLRLWQSGQPVIEDYYHGEIFEPPSLLERIYWSRILEGSKHIGLAAFSAICFYFLGRGIFL